MAIEKRSEILFLYEVKDANPNGDPLESNKPRIDPDTGVCTVTDVRIKRTIRDYWTNRKGLEILVRDTFNDDGTLKTGKARAKAFYDKAGLTDGSDVGEVKEKLRKVIVEECIDARVFGCTLPFDVKKKKGKKDEDKDKGATVSDSLTLTGPVQFSSFNRSYHRVLAQFVQGTAAFASEEKAYHKSFREDYLLPYALIGVYGVVNELASKTTGMTELDRQLLLEGLWGGTNDLISRSKIGHQPLMLLHFVYKDGFRLGDLAGKVTLTAREGLDETAIRSWSDYELDFSRLVEATMRAEGNIEAVAWKADPAFPWAEDILQSLRKELPGKTEALDFSARSFS